LAGQFAAAGLLDDVLVTIAPRPSRSAAARRCSRVGSSCGSRTGAKRRLRLRPFAVVSDA
jgi:hypothetical protein